MSSYISYGVSIVALGGLVDIYFGVGGWRPELTKYFPGAELREGKIAPKLVPTLYEKSS